MEQIEILEVKLDRWSEAEFLTVKFKEKGIEYSQTIFFKKTEKDELISPETIIQLNEWKSYSVLHEYRILWAEEEFKRKPKVLRSVMLQHILEKKNILQNAYEKRVRKDKYILEHNQVRLHTLYF